MGERGAASACFAGRSIGRRGVLHLLDPENVRRVVNTALEIVRVHKLIQRVRRSTIIEDELIMESEGDGFVASH